MGLFFINSSICYNPVLPARRITLGDRHAGVARSAQLVEWNGNRQSDAADRPTGPMFL